MTDDKTPAPRRGRPVALTNAQQLEAARLAESQATAARQLLEARIAEIDRAADMRRKIVAGGALIAKASQDLKVAEVLTELIAGLDQRVDRAAFDGWTPPVPPAVTEPLPDPSGGNQQEPSAPDPEPGAAEPELPWAVTTGARKQQTAVRGTTRG